MSIPSYVTIGGKLIATSSEMDGSDQVERQRIIVEDPDNLLAQQGVTDTTPSGGAYGAVVRVAGEVEVSGALGSDLASEDTLLAVQALLQPLPDIQAAAEALLTNTQLRAAAVPVSLATAPLPADAATETKLEAVRVAVAAIQGLLGVGATALGKAEDAAHASGDVGIPAWGVRNDSGATTRGANNDYNPLATDGPGRLGVTPLGGTEPFPVKALNSLDFVDGWDTTQGSQSDAAVSTDTTGTISGKLRGVVKLLASVINATLGAFRVIAQAATSGGATPYTLISAATTNATNIKASAGQVYAAYATNINAAIRYLNLHNTAGTPTAGVAVLWSLGIPGNTAGGGGAISIPPGLEFTAGIGITITTLPAGTVAVAAGDVVINLATK